MMEALVGAGIGVILGGGAVYFVLIGWVVEQREKAADRLDSVKTKLVSWSLAATHFQNPALGAAFAEQAEQVADEAARIRSAK